jgi:NADH-ubiquinone oxidoreductase chain 4
LLLIVSLGFLIKLPAYGCHLWLPKAHVEAPVSGSMVLAAVILKMRIYGFYRVGVLIVEVFVLYGNCLGVILFLGATLRALVALVQTDMKAIVAYSSIRHIGVIIGGFFNLIRGALKGSFIIIIAHGFCSSALFFLVNISYEQNNSRQVVLLGGQLGIFLRLAY